MLMVVVQHIAVQTVHLVHGQQVVIHFHHVMLAVVLPELSHLFNLE